MLTDEQRAAMRRPFLTNMDRLMVPGVKIAPDYVQWIAQKRKAFYVDQRRVPGDGEKRRVHRMLVAVGLAPKNPLHQTNAAMRAAEKEADHHPEAHAPAGLQGSRAPTPMPAWLRDGRPAPLRPPPRRQAVSP